MTDLSISIVMPAYNAAHLLPGDHDLSDYPIGYGYQWWVPDGEEGPEGCEESHHASLGEVLSREQRREGRGGGA